MGTAALNWWEVASAPENHRKEILNLNWMNEGYLLPTAQQSLFINHSDRLEEIWLIEQVTAVRPP
jgi:hypothetical protein